jgi:hypothetical protein
MGDSYPSALLHPSIEASIALPLLSGTYLTTSSTFCQPTLTVNNTQGTISQVTLGLGSNFGTNTLTEGTIKFTQGSTSGSGTAKMNGTNDTGSAFVQAGTETGAQNAPMKQQVGSGKVTFTQTATTFTVTGSPGGTSTFNIYYGKVSTTGVVEYAVFGGLDYHGCAEQGTITLE